MCSGRAVAATLAGGVLSNGCAAACGCHESTQYAVGLPKIHPGGGGGGGGALPPNSGCSYARLSSRFSTEGDLSAHAALLCYFADSWGDSPPKAQVFPHTTGHPPTPPPKQCAPREHGVSSQPTAHCTRARGCIDAGRDRAQRSRLAQEWRLPAVPRLA